jgi:hypothetical protein
MVEELLHIHHEEDRYLQDRPHLLQAVEDNLVGNILLVDRDTVTVLLIALLVPYPLLHPHLHAYLLD